MATTTAEAETRQRLLRNVKKEVKQIMEEAVTRKFVHEDSSHIVSFCAAVEACVLHGLKRRAAGFLRSNKIAALFTKVGKSFPPAEELCRKAQELELVFESKRSQSLSYSESTRKMPKVPKFSPQAVRHLWIHTALIEKVLDKIVLYLVENSSKFYEKEAILMDPVDGPILASLLVGPCALEYTKMKTADHFWTDPSADELVQRHRIHSGHCRQDSPTKRPALCIQKRHSSSSMDERPSPSPSARDYVESLHQNSRATLLFGKNNVLVQPRDDMEAIPGYLSLHQTADCMTLKWTPNQLMNGSMGDLEYERSVYWDYAMTIRLEEIVYLHCHQQVDCGGTVVLVSQDGIQRPPLRFPRGGHLLQFLSCLENGLLPHGQLDPPLWSQRGKTYEEKELLRLVYFGGVEPSLRKEVWPFLLGHYQFGMSEAERKEVDEQMRACYEQTMSEWLGCEAIVRQREKEQHAVALAKCSSGASIDSTTQRIMHHDSTISNESSQSCSSGRQRHSRLQSDSSSGTQVFESVEEVDQIESEPKSEDIKHVSKISNGTLQNGTSSPDSGHPSSRNFSVTSGQSDSLSTEDSGIHDPSLKAQLQLAVSKERFASSSGEEGKATEEGETKSVEKLGVREYSKIEVNKVLSLDAVVTKSERSKKATESSEKRAEVETGGLKTARDAFEAPAIARSHMTKMEVGEPTERTLTSKNEALAQQTDSDIPKATEVVELTPPELKMIENRVNVDIERSQMGIKHIRAIQEKPLVTKDHKLSDALEQKVVADTLVSVSKDDDTEKETAKTDEVSQVKYSKTCIDDANNISGTQIALRLGDEKEKKTMKTSDLPNEAGTAVKRKAASVLSKTTGTEQIEEKVVTMRTTHKEMQRNAPVVEEMVVPLVHEAFSTREMGEAQDATESDESPSAIEMEEIPTAKVSMAWERKSSPKSKASEQGKIFPKLKKRCPQGSSDSVSDKEEEEATDYVFRIVFPNSQSEFVAPELIDQGVNMWHPTPRKSSCSSCSRSSFSDGAPPNGRNHERAPLKLLCDNMKNQIISRAFYGWLVYCRHLSTVRTHLSGLVNHTIVEPDVPTDACGGLTTEVWQKFLQDCSMEEIPTAKVSMAWERKSSPRSKGNEQATVPVLELRLEEAHGKPSSDRMNSEEPEMESLCPQLDSLAVNTTNEATSPVSSIGTTYSQELLDMYSLNLHRIDKDVQRCDRNYWYFTPANLEKLRNIMCSYIWQHLEIGYVQGMCDLLAPLLVILDDEAMAFSCFTELMTRMNQNFPHGGAMDTHFANMRSLIQILDAELFELMHQNGDYTHFYFCYRWFLLDFKRELVYDDVFAVWEVIWAAKCVSSSHFVLFIALALVEIYRDIILENNMDFTDIIKFFNEMAEHHNIKQILTLARDLVCKVQTLIENK
ncbi:small G protein signaling modulator 1-like [Sinocyclocheilus rhinocerous]|uniref:small G protein signaling modulator 1-like n=1 Tax=Sinocyclocheilus rhinocerous TaxID=307959 RepID=UPI0007B7AFF0|nr:PREDICTED: small G protein signaling modulator 1-like [Sinocyclocheilus rhinocerous]